AFLAGNELGKAKREIVPPPLTILAEPPVAVEDRVAKRRGTQDVATAYLECLHSEQGQEIAAKHYYRPRLESVAAKYADRFPPLEMLTIDGDFGGWAAAQKTHFNEGGTFDRIYVRK